MSNKGKTPMMLMQAKKRSYLSWTKEMDEILVDVLHNQVKEGNIADGERKPQAYQAVADELRIKLGISITMEHVKNRIKCWKKHYAVISYIRAFTNFKWDEERKMIVITTEDLEQWARFVVDHPNAAAYRNKSIEHWDDICTLCGPDRALGDGVEMHYEVAEARDEDRAVGDGVEIHDEVAQATDEELQSAGGTPTKAMTSLRSKKQKRDRLADAFTNFAECFRDYVQSKPKEVPRPTPKEIYEVVKNVKGIGQLHVMRAAKRFMDGPANHFEMLKTLPEDEKLDWILLCLND